MRKILIFILLFWSVMQAEENYLERLVQGNQRFAEGKSTHPNRDLERLQETAQSQTPFAAIIGCSDSRVPLEIIFDQGIGDLFIVRVAGNVVGPVELASIEFAVLQLKTPLIMVVGHKNCGAINAVMEGKTEGMEAVVSLVNPAIAEAKKQPQYTLETAIKDNVNHVVNQLKGHPENLAELIEKKKLQVVGGYYNLTTGKVEILAP